MLPFNFIVLRTPTQSINRSLEIPLYLPTIFNEGLYLASHDFYKQLKKIDHLSTDEKIKARASLFKYWLRTSMRCTPFGTFAGTAIVLLGESDNEIILNGTNDHTRRVRLDMGYIYFLIGEIEKLSIVQDQIYLFCNNSIYETPLDIRYSEASVIDLYKDYKLTTVQKTDYLLFVLEKAKNGITINNLSTALSTFAEVGFDEAKQFILEMWSSQLLVSDLEPCVTGKEPFEQLISVIQNYVGIDSLKSQLNQIFEHLKKPEQGAEYYIETEALIKELPIPTINLKDFIQTDLFLSLEKREISRSIIESIVAHTEELMPLARVGKNSELDAFKKRFLEKYENKKVPLSIALDSDLGIGYAGIYADISGGNALIDDIGYLKSEKENELHDSLKDYILKKYIDYIKNNNDHIEISENELTSFKTKNKDLRFPDSIFIQGSIIKDNEKQFDKDNFSFCLTTLGGPSACNLLGRFTHGDEYLLDLTKEVLRKEEEKNLSVIFAEIAHLPQARIGNVLLRPILRNYEIPYVGKSGIGTDNQILLNDLYLCIRDDELIIISKKFNKRVIPRLTTAHNFSYKCLPIYKFLCDLQYQKISFGAIWDWGTLSQLKYLPRVVFKNIILKKARWKIELNDISELPTSPDNYNVFFNNFLSVHKMPEKVLYVEGDNQILIDFSSQECVEIFVTYLRKHKNVHLEEFLFSNDNCIVKDKKGQSYTNEIIIPVDNSVNNNKIKEYFFSENITDRKFYPGSEWLFVKVYCSLTTADKLLIEYLLPFVEDGKKQNLFDKFFFIRYKDDEPHLRIRFHNKDPHKLNKVLTIFTEILTPLLDGNLVDHIVVDTYIQETERYGSELIEEAESLFDIDSQTNLKILNMLEPGIEDNFRIFFAMRSIDSLLVDFNLSLNEKHALFKTLADGFSKEFGSSADLQKNINFKYKKMKQQIFSYMNTNNDLNNDFNELRELIRLRSIENAGIVHSILQKISKHKDKSLEDLMISYIHMSLNRLFISHQRKYELIIYHFLERYYSSNISIKQKLGNDKIAVIP